MTVPTHKQRAYKWGVDAETTAAEYLKRHLGFTIHAVRLRTQGGEIDILAQDGEVLVVVEVKARQQVDDGLFSITPAKQKRLIRAAEAVLMEANKFTGLEAAHTLNIRFDAVIITPNAPPHHLPNAWMVE